MNFKKIWNCSKVRFYILNTFHNYRFWLLSKKVYKTVNYAVDVNDYSMDYDFKILQKRKTVTKKRFAGYLYQNKIYLDNPGIPNIDRETWISWKNKGLIH